MGIIVVILFGVGGYKKYEYDQRGVELEKVKSEYVELYNEYKQLVDAGFRVPVTSDGEPLIKIEKVKDYIEIGGDLNE